MCKVEIYPLLQHSPPAWNKWLEYVLLKSLYILSINKYQLTVPADPRYHAATEEMVAWAIPMRRPGRSVSPGRGAGARVPPGATGGGRELRIRATGASRQQDHRRKEGAHRDLCGSKGYWCGD